MRAGAGLLLLALLALPLALGWRWSWLAAHQQEELYKRWTGALLLLFLGHQWWLAIGRSRGWVRAAKRSFHAHRYVGLAAPLFFFAHSQQLGFGFLVLLSTVFLGNTLLGLLHPGLLRLGGRRLTNVWLVTHVAASLLVAALALYHGWVAFYFE